MSIKYIQATVAAGLILLVSTICVAGDTDINDGVGNMPTAKDLSLNQDDQRPDEQYRVILFGRPLTIGGEYEFEPVYRKDFVLGRRGDDLTRLDQKLELEFLYEWAPDLNIFLEGKYKHRKEFSVEDGPEKTDDAFERGESWLLISRPGGGDWSLQAGRQNIREKREWWWDEDLDTVRVHFDHGSFHAELAAGEELGSVSAEEEIDPEKDDIFRILGRATWKWARKQRLEFFYIKQDDNSNTPVPGQILKDDKDDDEDADLTWYGLRAIGRIKHRPTGRYHYWIDTGYVHGRKTTIDFDSAGPGLIMVDTVRRRDVRGWAVDLGVTWETKLDGEPSFTLGFAHGSGDGNPAGSTDNSYHQTGLQDNNGKFRGVDRFRYYGELLRPELSNLNIYTVSVGFPILNNSSVEIPLHYYRQVDASPILRNSRLGASPDGMSRSIGTELDVVIGIEEWKHLELEFVAGLFRASDAFGSESGDFAQTAIFKLNYNF